jgi:glutathione S-transferase
MLDRAAPAAHFNQLEGDPMSLVYLVLGLALVQFLWFGVLVGRARGKYSIPAPAITGNNVFERHFRVQQNTLELLVILLPALPMFALYVSTRWAAALGVVYLIGRFMYAVGYVKEPTKRSYGFLLSIVPILTLLTGGLIGAIHAAVTG